jgi:Tfp pilus assembly protein PilF
LSSVRRAAGQYESAAPGLTLAASYFNRGVVFSRMGDEKRALEDFDKAIETDPSLAPAYGQRAIIYFHNRELVKSLSDVRQAGKLNYPINPKFLEALKLELQGRHISEDHV